MDVHVLQRLVCKLTIIRHLVNKTTEVGTLIAASVELLVQPEWIEKTSTARVPSQNEKKRKFDTPSRKLCRCQRYCAS